MGTAVLSDWYHAFMTRSREPNVTNLPYPTPTSPAATKRMRSNRRSDTKPEVSLRSLLHRSGLRFRKDYAIRLSTGKVVHMDVAFTRRKVAIFVDGCFWHRCPDHGTTPKSNRSYWIPKLNDNVERDRRVTADLVAQGWHVVRVWEHVRPFDAAQQIREMLTD